MGNECSVSFQSVDPIEDFRDARILPNRAKHPKLVENLKRRIRLGHPLHIYEEIRVIGEGSVGRVSKVKKRTASSRQLIRRGSHRRDNCGHDMNSMEGAVNFPASGSKFWSCSRRPSLVASVSTAGTETSSMLSEPTRCSAECENQTFAQTITLSAAPPVAAAAKAKHKARYALKSLHCKGHIKELRNEIEILTQLDHPCIVKPIETFKQKQNLFLVEELCTGGDLFSRDPYAQDEAGRIISSVLCAVDYMHKRNVIHRDLKYENIMFIDKSPQSDIMIIDFGLSKNIVPDEYLTTGAGTIYTMAPEVIMGKYNSKADVWSIGVLSYMLLSSQMPFYGKKRREVIQKILDGKYDFKGPGWKSIPHQAKKFVSEFLQVDPNKRPTAQGALHSQWLRECASTKRVPEEAVLGNVQSSLTKFSDYSLLKKLALLVLAHHSTGEEIGSLRDAFHQFDTGMRGAINKSEFKICPALRGCSEEEMDKMFHAADIDGTGLVKYTEFLAATLETHGAMDEERLQEAFDFFDFDGNGFISNQDIHTLLGEETRQANANKTIQEPDLMGDNEVSYEEFHALFDPKSQSSEAIHLTLK